MMNVKHSMMFGPVSRLVSYVDSWSQQGRKQGVAWWKHGDRRQEDVKRSPLQMSLRPFQHFSKCGSGHSRCSGSCHLLSHPLTFGILGRLPCTNTGSGMEDRGVLYQPRAQWKCGWSPLPHHYSSSRPFNLKGQCIKTKTSCYLKFKCSPLSFNCYQFWSWRGCITSSSSLKWKTLCLSDSSPQNQSYLLCYVFYVFALSLR